MKRVGIFAVVVLAAAVTARNANAQSITLTATYDSGTGIVTLKGSYDLGNNYTLKDTNGEYVIISEQKGGIEALNRQIKLTVDQTNPKTKGTFNQGYQPFTPSPWRVMLRIKVTNTTNNTDYWLYAPVIQVAPPLPPPCP